MNLKMFPWKPVIITFAVSFVLGTAFGRWEFSQQMRDKWRDPEARQKWILKRLDSKLHLNADQEKQAAEILRASAPQMEAVKSKIRPEMDALRQEVRQKISALLTPAQQKAYVQMEAEWQERQKKFREAASDVQPA